MKILLVDDSHAVAGLYQQMLEAHQYEVVTAYSGGRRWSWRSASGPTSVCSTSTSPIPPGTS